MTIQLNRDVAMQCSETFKMLQTRLRALHVKAGVIMAEAALQVFTQSELA